MSEIEILKEELQKISINEFKDEDGFISTWDSVPHLSTKVEVVLRNGIRKTGSANRFDFSQPHPCENDPHLVSKWKYI